MIQTLNVKKVHHPVQLTYDGEGLRIDGDFNAEKKGKPSRTCGCIPLPSPKRSDPTLLPIDNINILHAFYNERTNMVQIHALVPQQYDKKDSSLDLYKFMYTVEEEKKEEAIEFCNFMLENVYKGLKRQKRLKVLINPFSGQGRAYEIFEQAARPILESAQCELDVRYTEDRGHAMQIAKELDINAYDAIVTVSGDGIIHEVLNGLLQRPDAREAIRKIPLGIIPGGTGNALSISLLGEKAGFDPTYTALQIIKGKRLDIDICSVTYADHRYFSFLSHNYGITSYADLGTENMRWMGDGRIVLGFMKEIFARNTYPVEVAIQVVEDDKEVMKAEYRAARSSAEEETESKTTGEIVDTIPPLSEPVPENWRVIKENVTLFFTSKVPWIGRSMLTHPYALPNDGLLDLLLVRGKAGTMKKLDVFAKVEKGEHLSSKIVEYYKIKAFRLTPIEVPGRRSYVAIDGEHAPVRTFQVEVHPRLASVLSLHSQFADTSVA
ncbi:sphinganine kinase lcb4 [Apophysomyces ossiformis]|uniref:Sphinganine kinase lcb4 n=1 Tax=Apophysomyces ossiformis TaxID=679940 RepID=A0A8H7BDE5_9FUNG|nr:sphinganine kinase lcb4 [Apophysomyces ossiformis]